MKTPDSPSEAFLYELLKHDQPSLIQFLFLYVICSRLRREWPEFGLEHFQSIADDLNIDTGTISIRPRDLHVSSCELGEVAAAVWMEPPGEWSKWKQRLIAQGELPSEQDLALLLEKILKFPFIKNAWWAEGSGRGE